MSTYHLQIHLGETSEGRMPWPSVGEYADRFRKAGDPLEVEADDVSAALEEAYRLANIGVPSRLVNPGNRLNDWLKSYRERDRSRSLSVGDVVVVNGEAGYTVDSMGFRPVNDHERAALARTAERTRA